MALDINIKKVDARTCIVALTGSLDTATAPSMDQKMNSMLADPSIRAVRMDLQNLAFISSIGLGSLAKVKASLAARGGAMVTVGMQPQIARVFEIVKMLPKESIFSSREEADEYLAAIQKNVIEENRAAKK